MKNFGNYKYEIENNDYFPIVINFYFRYSNEELGFIEIYENGILYSDMFDGGIHCGTVRKMLKIADKERKKLILKQKFRRDK